ncbi:dnaJ homolog subfamily C member 4 [Nematostella vectensis]|uniref:dnaJ homolog subfamily C member 4 n=1 Tax=Nematostella vectensis TaxID=45351 RepID=UPI00207721AA|nr:dnaJ homolog subfamily C member 4 [Nematostella vectensis]
MFPHVNQLLASQACGFSVCQSCPLSTSSALRTRQKKKNFYEILDVPKDASQTEIKSAFIKKTKEFHPDVNPDDPDSHKAFIKVSEAYTTLSSSARRQQYDARLNSSFASTYRPATASTYSSSSPFGHRDGEHQYYRNRYRTSGIPHHASRPVKSPYNKTVILGTLLFMAVGAAVHYGVLHFNHKKYKEQVEKASRQANQAYSDAKERAKTNTLQKQLELLTAHHDFHVKAGRTAKRVDSTNIND